MPYKSKEKKQARSKHRYHNDPEFKKLVQFIYTKSWRKITRRNKIRAVEMLGGKCMRCGYNEILEILCFHHIKPEEKTMTIGRMLKYSWEKVKEEVKKCALLCPNCHAIVHLEERERKWNEKMKERAISIDMVNAPDS